MAQETAERNRAEKIPLEPEGEALLPGEVWDVFTPYYPRTHDEARVHHTPRDVAREFLKNPGRFRSPLTLLERLRLHLIATSPQTDFFGWENNFRHMVSLPVPYAWQVLLQYLRGRGVIDHGRGRCSMPHDGVKLTAVRFHLQGLEKKNFLGSGNAFDLETAYSKSIGEALERFFLMQTKVSRPHVDVWASLLGMRQKSKPCVAPASLSQFTAAQRGRSPRLAFDDDSVFAWVLAREIVSDTAAYVPAQVFSLQKFSFQHKKEPLLREQNTNAAAGGFTVTEALLSALYEGIERDGFLIYWLNAIAPPRIDAAACQDEKFQKLLAALTRYRLEAVFLNTTTDLGIPTCVCVLIDRTNNRPCLTMGAGCGFDISRMLHSSLLEALMISNGLGRTQQPTRLAQAYTPFVDGAIDLHERVRLWLDPEMFPRGEWFLSGPIQSLEEAFPQARSFPDREAELEAVKAIFRKMGPGYEIYAYEHQHEVLRTIEYHVLKVAVPKLVNMYLFESNAHLGAERLKSVPRALGHEPAEGWNPWPHPFP